VQRLGALTVERVVVVELQRLPRLSGVGVPIRVAGRLEGLDADVVAHHVVRVRVAAVLVVRRHHVRLEAPDQPDQRLGRLFDRDQPEAALGQRRLGVPLGPAGVHEPQPVLAHAEDLASPVHLLAAHRGHVLEHVRAVHLGVQNGAALATGAGDDVYVDPLGDVLGGAGRALARLVVGVGVDVHQTEHGGNPRMTM
jgi:hypothetical protein